ncbi:MAG TPA: hypothetical protein VHB21_11720 [Minicystis sp.]|nr:hypothetical protein [Minicystis sp.]
MTRHRARTHAALSLFLFAAGAALSGGAASCGGSDGGAGGGATGGGGSGGGGGAKPDCATLCDEAMKNCTGDDAVYVSAAVCEAVCADLPVGAASDTSGDTVGCRVYHAGAPAKMDPALHCQHAGPGGAGYCGSNCEGFCSIAVPTCGKLEGEFKDEKTCMQTCAKFPDSMQPFSVADTTGDTLQCRLYHVSVATLDPKTHCPHITLASTPGTCQDPMTP